MNTSPRTPQDKAINHSLIVKVYEIWEYEGIIHGSIVDWKPAWEAKKDYPLHYDLKGHTAHYLLLFHDASILRADAINFARAIEENKVRYIHIDFAYWNDYGKQKR